MSDSASRISSLETELSAMDKAFRTEIAKLQNQALDQAKSQLLHGNMLNEILTTLKQLNTTTDKPVVLPDKSEAANPQRLLTPATPLELLARVNTHTDLSSDSCGSSEDYIGEPHSGDLYVGLFGDVITVKPKNTLRIGFQNVGCFPGQRGKLKEDLIKIGLNKWEFDVFGFAETNLDWRMLKGEDKLPLRTQEWWETQNISWSHNRTGTPRQPKQFGGTALFSINQAARQVIEKG
jgi:hypothetical protein